MENPDAESAGLSGLSPTDSPELVIDGANGIVVPEGAPAALAAALERLAATPTLRTALAIRAREVAVERFDAKANVARFLEVLEAGGAGG